MTIENIAIISYLIFEFGIVTLTFVIAYWGLTK